MNRTIRSFIIFSLVQVIIFLLPTFSFAQITEITQKTKKGNTLYGFKFNNKQVLKNKYQEIRDFSNGRAAICYKNNWGFIDSSGKIVIAPQYYLVKDFSSKSAIVSTKSKVDQSVRVGLIGKNGEHITNHYYKNMIKMIPGYVLAVDHNKNNYVINENGKTCIENFDSVGIMLERFILVYGSIEEKNRRNKSENNLNQKSVIFKIYDGKEEQSTEAFIWEENCLNKENPILKLSSSGKYIVLIAPNKYSSPFSAIQASNYGFFIASNGKLKGVLNEKAELIVPTNYKNLKIFKHWIIAENNESYILFDKTGRVIADDLQFAEQLNNNFYHIKLKNNQGAQLIYTDYWVSNSSFSKIVKSKNGLIKVFDFKNPEQYTFVKNDGKLVEEQFNVELKPVYEKNASGFGLVLKAVTGIILFDIATGRKIVPDRKLLRYDPIEESEFVDGKTIVSRRFIKPKDPYYRNYGCLDTSGAIIVPLVYDFLKFAGPVGYVYFKNSKAGIINEKQEVIVPNTYYDINYLGENYFSIANSTYSYALAKLENGKLIKISNYVYNEIKPISEGFFEADDFRWGFINTKGERICKFEFTSTQAFKNGKAKVNNFSDSYFIDYTGKKVEE